MDVGDLQWYASLRDYIYKYRLMYADSLVKKDGLMAYPHEHRRHNLLRCLIVCGKMSRAPPTSSGS